MSGSGFRPYQWVVAARLFAAPASLVPVIFGTVAAVRLGEANFDPWRFAVAMTAMLLLHTGANMLNDVADYRRGLDREVQPGSGAIVRGYLTEREVLRGALLLLAAGCGLGLWLALRVGWTLLWIGLAGVILGAGYSWGLGLKYRGFGDVVVFTVFGLLAVQGAWVVQTKKWAWPPLLWAVPAGLHVAAILHANNWRDLMTDTSRGGFRTLAGYLGHARSYSYYVFLLFFPFVWVTILAFVPPPWGLPRTILLTWLSLPLAIGTCGRLAYRRRAEGSQTAPELDARTAQFGLLFGLLYSLGVFWSS